ncbi:hypothetical protein [Evansella tamaricis]|uniref:Uncharacterized protein n=1 Tax=Evansella tamaricis TaxID=2069301 RepID=A0ABS6JNF8_9BACI|nr:hypothetical protein [Evansella tamaricis]MBU9714915.1 hypothetical protein [Evansella tamaricis]
MEKKQFISFAVVILIVIAVSVFFKEPSLEDGLEESLETEPEQEQEEAEDDRDAPEDELTALKRELQDLNLKYLNLEGEKRSLEQELEWVTGNIKELEFFIVRQGLLEDLYQEMYSYEIDVLYQGNKEDGYVLLYQGPYEDVWLSVAKDREERASLSLREGEREIESITVETGRTESGFLFGGYILDESIVAVQVNRDGLLHDGEIVQMEDNQRLWYSLFAHGWNESDDGQDEDAENNIITIQALNQNGDVVWEMSLNPANVGPYYGQAFPRETTDMISAHI